MVFFAEQILLQYAVNRFHDVTIGKNEGNFFK